MTVEELVQLSMQQNADNFKAVRQDMSHLRRDTAEAKALAANATTIAQDTKVKLTSLEARVTALEKGEGSSSTKGHGKGASYGGPRTSASSDWEQLGTTEGNTAIVGGFRSWASREERQEDFEKIRTELPNELAAQISEIIVPAAPGRIVIVKLVPHPLGTKETRVAILSWCKKFKELKQTGLRDAESEPQVYFAMPSKPFEMRQRDTHTTIMMAGLKALNPSIRTWTIPNSKQILPTAEFSTTGPYSPKGTRRKSHQAHG